MKHAMNYTISGKIYENTAKLAKQESGLTRKGLAYPNF